jgi:hypothetical protein
VKKVEYDTLRVEFKEYKKTGKLGFRRWLKQVKKYDESKS